MQPFSLSCTTLTLLPSAVVRVPEPLEEQQHHHYINLLFTKTGSTQNTNLNKLNQCATCLQIS